MPLILTFNVDLILGSFLAFGGPYFRVVFGFLGPQWAFLGGLCKVKTFFGSTHTVE